MRCGGLVLGRAREVLLGLSDIHISVSHQNSDPSAITTPCFAPLPPCSPLLGASPPVPRVRASRCAVSHPSRAGSFPARRCRQKSSCPPRLSKRMESVRLTRHHAVRRQSSRTRHLPRCPHQVRNQHKKKKTRTQTPRVYTQTWTWTSPRSSPSRGWFRAWSFPGPPWWRTPCCIRSST